MIDGKNRGFCRKEVSRLPIVHLSPQEATLVENWANSGKAKLASQHANPELSGRLNLPKCVETIYEAPQAGDEIVHPSMKIEEQGVLES